MLHFPKKYKNGGDHHPKKPKTYHMLKNEIKCQIPDVMKTTIHWQGVQKK